jgi:hypothetical protein
MRENCVVEYAQYFLQAVSGLLQLPEPSSHVAQTYSILKTISKTVCVDGKCCFFICLYPQPLVSATQREEILRETSGKWCNSSEIVVETRLRSPGIDSQPVGPVPQPYLS